MKLNDNTVDSLAPCISLGRLHNHTSTLLPVSELSLHNSIILMT